MKRGDLVIVREPGSPASKSRPCVIIGRDRALDIATKVTVCPLTSRLRGAVGERPFVAPSPRTGLRVPSEVEVDWVFTHPIEFIGATIGSLDTPSMAQVDDALRRWLDL